MSFLQVQQSLVSHRKMLRLERLLSLDRYSVVGRLVALWSWCLDNALGGRLGDIDADILADVMGWDVGMGKPAELLEALLTAGFLELDEVDGRIYIHDWHDHMGRLIERREASADRMRKMRARRANESSSTSDALGSAQGDAHDIERSQHSDMTVTHTLRDKRRVEQRRVTLLARVILERENARTR